MATNKPKPKYPHAKTFTNGRGQVQNIARPKPAAVRPKPNPITGVVPGRDPLSAAVTSAVQGQIKPYQDMDANRSAQYERDFADQRAIQDEVQKQLLGIHRTLATANNDALGLAAQRGAEVPGRMAANQNFLKEVLGNYVGDGGAGVSDAVDMGAARVGAAAAGNVAETNMQGRASEGELSAIRASENLAHSERAAALMAKRQADQAAIQQEIARIKAGAPLLRRQFGRENAELNIAKDDLALRRQQTANEAAANQAQIDLGYYQTDAQAAAALAGNAADAAKDAAANRGKYGYSIDKKYDSMLDDLFKSVAAPQVANPADPTKTMPNPARRWRSLVTAMQGMGLTGGQAVLLASKWVPERLKIHGKDSPRIVYKLLKSGELGFKVSDAVAKQVFASAGLNWSLRNKKPVQAGLPHVSHGSGPGGAVNSGDLAGGAIGAGQLENGVTLG